ncbi:MAG: YfcE family phosphodiesterase [Chthoniobacteraceae bacterium]|nr:YfcE family phosphodiesterase [Chthoniobacteraceae bacterium]
MRIAVIADTHNRVSDRVRDAISGADEIWHLGDVCEPAILESLKKLGPPLRVVRGNCDSNEEWPLTLDFELEGFQIQLIHIPPRKAPAGCALLFHGHTHVPRDETIGGTRYLNPGCITRPNRGAPASFAWLELEENQPPNWSLVRV